MPGEKEALEKRESEVGGKRIGVRKKKKKKNDGKTNGIRDCKINS